MSGYSIALENGAENLPEMFPLYATHYREMQERLERDGFEVSQFNPQIDAYISHWEAGTLLNYAVRLDGEAVGYSNVYLAKDMHNSELIAQEDTIFILKDHRNGVGRKLVRFILEDLNSRGVKRAHVTAMTDLRVVPVWKRMGFKPVATSMIYTFPR